MVRRAGFRQHAYAVVAAGRVGPPPWHQPSDRTPRDQDRDEDRRTLRPRGAQRWRAKSTRMRVACSVYGLPTPYRRPGGRGAHSCPQCPPYPQRSGSELGSPRRCGDANGVSRTFNATMLVAVALGPTAVPSPLLGWPDQVIPTSRASDPILTALAHRARPDDIGDEPVSRFGWPLPGSPTVVRAFQPPTSRYGPGHRGVDLASAAGTPVLAAGAGTVVFAGTVAGHGVVSVDHPGGLRTTYEPVAPIVTAGDRVARGQRIGAVQPGHPGCPVTACLHWGVLRRPATETEQGRQYLDPLRLLAGARVRLLPIDDSADQL